MELKQPERGKEALDNAVETDHKVGYGLPYIYLLQYELDRTGPVPDAIQRLEDGLNKFASTENFFRMGVVYKRKGNRQKAGECLIRMFQRSRLEYCRYDASEPLKPRQYWGLRAMFQEKIFDKITVKAYYKYVKKYILVR